MIDKLSAVAAAGTVDAREADSIVKMIKSAKSLNKDVDSLGNIYLAIQEFVDFMDERDSEMLKKLQPYLTEFGNAMSKKYGRKQ